MKKILTSDLSLRKCCLKNAVSLSFKDKLDIAKNLSNLGVDTIEFDMPENKAEEVLIKTVCTSVNCCVAINCDLSEEGIKKAVSLLKQAKEKRIILNFPSSPARIEYSSLKKPKNVLSKMEEIISKCSNDIEVEVVLEDSINSENEFLKNAVKACEKNGARFVTLTDIEGNKTPCEIAKFITDAVSYLENQNTVLGLSVNNSYSFALTNYIGAAESGAKMFKISSVVSDLPQTDVYYKVFESVGEKKGFNISLNKVAIGRTVKSINELTKENKSLISTNSNEDKNEVLNSDISLSELTKTVKKLGYDLSTEDMQKVYNDFLRLSAKKQVSKKELEVVIANDAMQVKETYSLKSYSVQSSNVLTSTASVTLVKNGKEISGLSFGNGSVDSAFLAIENITGRHFDLDDFELGAVTEGKEAMGQTLVKLRYNGSIYSGRGISTDIVGASIRAYLNALNKIMHEEEK